MKFYRVFLSIILIPSICHSIYSMERADAREAAKEQDPIRRYILEQADANKSRPVLELILNLNEEALKNGDLSKIVSVAEDFERNNIPLPQTIMKLIVQNFSKSYFKNEPNLGQCLGYDFVNSDNEDTDFLARYFPYSKSGKNVKLGKIFLLYTILAQQKSLSYASGLAMFLIEPSKQALVWKAYRLLMDDVREVTEKNLNCLAEVLALSPNANPSKSATKKIIHLNKGLLEIYTTLTAQNFAESRQEFRRLKTLIENSNNVLEKYKEIIDHLRKAYNAQKNSGPLQSAEAEVLEVIQKHEKEWAQEFEEQEDQLLELRLNDRITHTETGGAEIRAPHEDVHALRPPTVQQEAVQIASESEQVEQKTVQLADVGARTDNQTAAQRSRMLERLAFMARSLGMMPPSKL